MSTENVAVPVDPPADLPVAQTAYRLLETVGRQTDESWREDTRRIMKAALPSFPELAGRTVTVGVMDPDHPKDEAQADWWNDLVVFTPARRPWVDTVFHELTHLAVWRQNQDGADVPHTSEEYCSILSTTRIDPEWIERGDIAYLGEPSIPKERWPDACQRALDYRAERGAGSHYIKFCRRELGIEE